jgi:predicted nucleic acid-binding protein
MNYLLDTCVLSEFTRRQPNPRVIEWLDSIDEDRLHISVLTIGEIQRGIERLAPSRRKSDLFVWMNEYLIKRFANRLVNIDAPTMFLWGSLTARLEALGHRLSSMDSLIAASALQNNLIVVTRNVTDFSPTGVQVINPWD